TQRTAGGKADSSEVVESIRRAAGADTVVASSNAAQDGSSSAESGSSSGEQASSDPPEDSEDGGGSSGKFVEAVPQSSAYALVIGIEKYRDLPAPTGAAADAKRMTELLTRSFGLPGDHVRTLVDDHATRTDLEAALEWVANSVPEGGRIYFYYAGHGTPHPKKGTSLVLPYEASQSNLTGSGLALDD
ncbi:MAG: caspase family protein, partial [Bradymonadaceae bacterium]